MSFYPLKISLADKTTGLPITTYTQLNLRSSVDSYATAKYSQLAVSGGTYTFGSVGDPIIPGLYKLYDDTTELTAFGVYQIGEPAAALKDGDNAFTGDNTFAGTSDFAGDVTVEDITVNGNMAVTTGSNLTVADAPVADTEVVRLIDLGDYASLTAGNDFVGTQNFQDDVSFENDPPTCASPPVTGSSLVNQDYIQGIIDAIEVTPYQESDNVIRLMPSGIKETNKVYKVWTECQTVAGAFSDTNRRMTIEIRGTGTSQNYITVNSQFENYVSVKGDNQNVILKVADDTYTVTAGSVIVENLQIQGDGSTTDTPVFTNFVFKDVYFNMDSTSIGFVACQFRGNCYIKNTGSISFDGNCVGGYVATNGTITARMFGMDGLTSTDF